MSSKNRLQPSPSNQKGEVRQFDRLCRVENSDVTGAAPITIPAGQSTSGSKSSIVIVSSVQDYRLKRRGSIQAIAGELARCGHDVIFISVRFSALSRLRADPRIYLGGRANVVEVFDGVKCFLWRTPLHPIKAHNRLLNALLTPLFHLYTWYPNSDLDDLFRSAETVIIESGLSIALLPRIRRLNPKARLIYRGSDRLSAIGQHAVLARMLRRHQAAFDAFCLLGAGIADDFAWAFPNAFIVPPALDYDSVEATNVSPYEMPVNAVSLGAMLFDPSFFALAAPRFPDVTFHIFGVQPIATVPANVRFHSDILYTETWRHIQHATFGIAPYRNHDKAEYLADTSSKLLQYSAVGLPSVCPHFAVGKHTDRFGYTPGDASSIEAAVKRALAAPRRAGGNYRKWSEIVPRLLAPREYSDTLLSGPASKPRTSPVLSLIVATRGRVELLGRLLSSLQQEPQDLFEVIVVDQNDPGVLDELLREFGEHLEIVHLRSTPGVSLARNVGLAASRGAIVGFPDDDCWYPAGRVDEVIRFFDVYNAVDILLGQTVDADGVASVNAVRSVSERVTPANVWFSGNSNTLFMRQPLAGALGFDEGLGVGAPTPFQSGEETDLILRAMRQGARAVYCPNLKIHHDQVNDRIGPAQLQRAWRYSIGFGQVLRRHYANHYPLYRIARSLGGALFAFLQGKMHVGLYRSIWSLGTLHGWIIEPQSTYSTKRN